MSNLLSTFEIGGHVASPSPVVARISFGYQDTIKRYGDATGAAASLFKPGEDVCTTSSDRKMTVAFCLARGSMVVCWWRDGDDLVSKMFHRNELIRSYTLCGTN